MPTLFIDELYEESALVGPLLVSEIVSKLFSTALTIALMVLIYFAASYFIAKRVTSKKIQRQYRLRVLYLVLTLLTIFIAKTWIDGFIHLFALLGLVSAALVITQKENIMNFFAGLIIMWRELFSEDDFVQIANYAGRVKTIGLLYFSLDEVDTKHHYHFTGKRIKLPNSLIITNPLVNFAHDHNLMYQTITLVLRPESDIEKAKKIISEYFDTALAHHLIKFEQAKSHPRKKYIFPRFYYIASEAQFDKPEGILLTISFYAEPKEIEKIEQAFWDNVLNKKQPLFKTLAFESTKEK